MFILTCFLPLTIYLLLFLKLFPPVYLTSVT